RRRLQQRPPPPPPRDRGQKARVAPGVATTLVGRQPVSSTPVKILVPGNHLMVGLVGQRDELLRLVEAAFPGTRILVRGNEIDIEGDDADRVGQLFTELVLLLE